MLFRSADPAFLAILEARFQAGAEAVQAATQRAEVVNIANWSSGNPTTLEPHEPEPTDVIVTLGAKH